MVNRLSIIIPIYNEKKFLEKFFIDLFDVFQKIFVEYIIINDCSSDGSEVWIDKYIKPACNKKIDKITINNDKFFSLYFTETKSKFNYSTIKLINHEENEGKGASVIDGLKISTGKYLMILDSDLEYDSRDSLNMLNLIKENKMGEVVFGSRFTSDLPHRHHYVLNSIVNHFNTFLFNILFDSAISDIHCGSKIFTRNVYNKINLTSKDFSIDMDLGTQIVKAGFSISEVGVRYYSRSYNEGKKITWVDGILGYWYLFKFRFIKNDFRRNFIILLSALVGLVTGAHFGDGIGKLLATIFGGFFGAIFGTRYSFAGLLGLLIFLLIGSQFSKGNGVIFTVFLGLIAGIYFAKKSDKIAEKLSQLYFSIVKN